MPNPQNVEPHKWKPGQSGNPNGRPRTRVFTRALRKALREKTDDDKTKLQELAIRTVEFALGGSAPHLREVADRIEGKVPDEVIVNGTVDLEQRRTGLDSLLDALRDRQRAGAALPGGGVLEPPSVRNGHLEGPVENGETSGSSQ